jgi:WD40 repeat protein
MSFCNISKRRKFLTAVLLAFTLSAVLISCLAPHRSQPGGNEDRGTTLVGHRLPVQALAFGADGVTLTSAAYVLCKPHRAEVMVWDVAAGQPAAPPAEYSDTVRCLALAPGGRALVAARQEGSLALWEAAAVRRRLLSKPGTPLQAVAFSWDGSQLATADFEFVVTLWDVASGQPRACCQANAWPAYSLAFAPGGAVLASGGNDGVIRLWDTATGAALGALRENFSLAVALAFSPDGATLASGGMGGVVILWDVAARSPRATLALAGESKLAGSEVTAVAFAPDGRTLAVATDQSVQLWDVASSRLLARLEGHEGKVLCVAFSPDGKRLASGSYDQTVRLWEVPNR